MRCDFLGGDRRDITVIVLIRADLITDYLDSYSGPRESQAVT